MGFLDKYPYTDFHELNLDWFLERFRELAGAVEDIQHTLDAITPLIESLPEYEQLTDQIKIVLYGDPDDPLYPNTGLIYDFDALKQLTEHFITTTYPDAMNLINTALTDAENEINKIKITGIGTTLYAVLAAGQTTAQITDDVIDTSTGNIRLELFTSIQNMHPSVITIAGNVLSITFPSAAPSDVSIMARIGKYNN